MPYMTMIKPLSISPLLKQSIQPADALWSTNNGQWFKGRSRTTFCPWHSSSNAVYTSPIAFVDKKSKTIFLLQSNVMIANTFQSSK